MLIEYANYDISNNDNELKIEFDIINKLNINTVSVLPCHTKLAKNNLKPSIKIATVIDYPLGCSSISSRSSNIVSSIKEGSSIIELVIPSHSLCNRKYDKIKSDIETQYKVCSEAGVELRYILEYRIFQVDSLYRITQLLKSNNVDTILPSTGYFLDDISDNLIVCALISKKISNINIICNGKIWNEKQFGIINNQELYGFRCYSLNSLKKIDKISLNK